MVNNSTAAAATHPNAGAVTNAGVKTTFDTLYISDIGYGMSGGPISMGRFGLGKYMPPDRSNEILPLDQKTTQESSKNTTTENSDTTKDVSNDNAIDDKNLIIKAVSTAGNSNSPKYIRDAERFTELSGAALTTGPACNAGSKIAQSNI